MYVCMCIYIYVFRIPSPSHIHLPWLSLPIALSLVLPGRPPVSLVKPLNGPLYTVPHTIPNTQYISRFGGSPYSIPLLFLLVKPFTLVIWFSCPSQAGHVRDWDETCSNNTHTHSKECLSFTSRLGSKKLLGST